jgi:hypothetical protein
MNYHASKARLVLRVGIVGHRPNRLQSANHDELGNQLRRVLGAVRDTVARFATDSGRLFTEGPPILRALSPLAEGTDRLFAEAALDLGYELCCPMPFLQAEFEKDFLPPHALEPDSLARFRALFARAEQQSKLMRFEMDGSRANEGEAYGACGRVLLNQSDLLVVVWDGQRRGLPGGTEETFDEARRKGVPIVWVDAHAPHDWQLLDSATSLPPAPVGIRQSPISGASLDQLGQTVRHALDLPTPAETKTSPSTPSVLARFWSRGQRTLRLHARAVTIEDFFAERKPRISRALLWIPFRNFADRWRLSLPPFRVPEFETGVQDEWPRDRSTPLARLIDWLRPFYAWPDKLAVTHSDAYRSAFVLVYLAAALAVAMALLPLSLGWAIGEPHPAETAFVAIELFLIVAILLVVARGRSRRWHERWLDYRLVAELVRHLRLVVPLGGNRPFPQVPAQWGTYGRPAVTWMAWYVRAVERDLGLPTAVLDNAHIRACMNDLSKVLEGQVDYHAANTARSHRIETKLYACGLLLLVLTLVACAVHLSHSWAGSTDWPAAATGSLVFLSGFLPALGAAFAGISNQAEFRRVAKRSEAMLEQLSELKEHVDAFVRRRASPSPELPGVRLSGEATELATGTAQVMVNEVLDWP